MKHWLSAVAVALACGCGAKSLATDESPKKEPPPSDPLGNLAEFGDMLSKRLSEPGPYDEARSSPGFAKDDEDKDYVAVFELSGQVTELRSFSWTSPDGGIELLELVNKLDALAKNERVSGLMLRVGELRMSMAAAEELRAALVAFSDETCPVTCHVEQVSNLTYYVLTACDAIALAPGGEVEISGVAVAPVHIKGLLDKLGMKADFLHIGAYKGAAEPLLRDAPSSEMRQTLQSILDQAYATYVRAIAEGRKLAPKQVEALIDEAMFHGEQAVKAGLVDSMVIYEQFRAEVIGERPWKVIAVREEETADMAALMQFLGVIPRPRPFGDHVALVYAVGNVIDGKGEGILGARQEIASRTLAAALRAMAADDAVKAVVLRIDSGGGSALASELIWHAVAEVKAKKPVIVSMGGMAASGGYYIAAGATKIFAAENTLTGSIGVVGGKITAAEGLGKLGIQVYPMGRGKRALLSSAVSPWTEDEREAVKKMMSAVYGTFVSRVAAGRGKSEQEIDAIAQGRVWTGVDAKARGLVDEVGGLTAALAEARKLAGVESDTELEIYPPEPTIMDIVLSLGEVSAPSQVDLLLAELSRDLTAREAEAVRELIEAVRLFQRSSVLAAALFPIVVE